MAKKKKRTPGLTAPEASGSPATATPAAAPKTPAAAAVAAPAPAVEEYREVDLSLSLRWHLATILIITVITLALFGFYKWAIRFWADDKLVLARAYYDQALEIKPDFFQQPDGYTPLAKEIESVMVDGVNFQAFLVEMQKLVNQTATTSVPVERKVQIQAFKQRLGRLALEIFPNPGYTMEPPLQNQIDLCTIKVNEIVKELNELENTSFESSDALADKLWQIHLSLVDFTTRMRSVRGCFDYMAALDMAIEESRRAVGSDNAYPAAFHLLAQALEEQGLLEDAADQYLAVVEIEPGSELSRAIVAKYEKLAQDAPQDMNAHYTLGRIYRELGRTDDALAQLRTAIELDIKVKDGGSEENPNTYTGYLARRVFQEVKTGTRNEQYPGREG